jgi:dethiobiotin synthetase
MRGYFISGTDTDVGKTVLTLGLMTALKKTGMKVGGMKPVASGCIRTKNGLRNEDALQIQSLSDNDPPYEQVNPYAFVPPVAPHVAATETGIVIDLLEIKKCYENLLHTVDAIIVEGVGGWRVPFGNGLAVPDLVLSLDLPVILVVGLKIGCINHAILTAEAMIRDGVQLKAWVANEITPDYTTLTPTLEYLNATIPGPMLGCIPFMETPDIDDIAANLTLSLLKA